MVVKEFVPLIPRQWIVLAAMIPDVLTLASAQVISARDFMPAEADGAVRDDRSIASVAFRARDSRS